MTLGNSILGESEKFCELLMVMRDLEVKEGEDEKMFFIECGKVVMGGNLKIYYISGENVGRIVREGAWGKCPDPKSCLIGFTLNTERMRGEGG